MPEMTLNMFSVRLKSVADFERVFHSNGNGAGQLAYSAINAPDISTIGTQKQVAWLRYFNNNGGSPITVYEVGIYTRGTVGNATVYFMLCRDLLSGGVVVADTGQLMVTYTLQLTYPA